MISKLINWILIDPRINKVSYTKAYIVLSLVIFIFSGIYFFVYITFCLFEKAAYNREIIDSILKLIEILVYNNVFSYGVYQVREFRREKAGLIDSNIPKEAP